MKDMDFSAFDSIVDCRSPVDYPEDYIPGAISAPVLEDAERATVGTMYKQLSPFEAKKLGAALVAKNVARHVQTLFADKPRGWRPLVYCWRGGKRSRAEAQVFDLEGLARPRGSVLGELPGLPQPTQKRFESLLLHELSALDPGRPVFVEGESKKIGQLQVPEALIARMRGSECVLLDTTLEARVQLLIEEYRHFLAATRSLQK